MLTAILTGVFGLMGVVVGAAVTAWMNQRADNRREVGRASEAWMLLRDDARVALEVAKERLDKGRWPIVSHQDWSSVWRSSRGMVVRHVEERDFEVVSAAFARIDRLESAVNTPRDPNDRTLSALDREFLEDMSARLSTALETLERAQPAAPVSPGWRRSRPARSRPNR